PERERQALDLPGHDVRRRTRDQYEVAGDVHAQLGREVRADPVADVRERLLDATRSREVGAHEDVGLAEVLRHDALERGRTRGDHAEHRLEVLRLLEERLRLRRRDDVAVLVDDEVARAAPVEAALEQLHVVDQRDRRGDAGEPAEEALQILDLAEHLPALEKAGARTLDDDVEGVAADDLAVDRLGVRPYLGLRVEVVEEVGVDADRERADETGEGKHRRAGEDLGARRVGVPAEPRERRRQARRYLARAGG